jgi:hypothetical protein
MLSCLPPGPPDGILSGSTADMPAIIMTGGGEPANAGGKLDVWGWSA